MVDELTENGEEQVDIENLVPLDDKQTPEESLASQREEAMDLIVEGLKKLTLLLPKGTDSVEHFSSQVVPSVDYLDELTEKEELT